MDKMNITLAEYVKDSLGQRTCIKVVVDEEQIIVPLVQGNRHYDEIMKQVESGELTIGETEL